MYEQTPLGQPEFPSAHQLEIFPPWEDTSRPGTERWWETVKGVFAAPTNFFTRMNTNRGLGAPLIFGVIGGSIGGVMVQLYNHLLQSFNLMLMNYLPQEARQQFAQMSTFSVATNTISTIAAMLFTPIFVVIGLFIGAAITHLFLLLLSSAKQGFEATFRVNAYIVGSLGMLQIIPPPCCMGWIVFFWMLIVQIIGLSRAHGISTGKAAAAVLLPFVIICGCCALAFGSIFALGLVGVMLQGTPQ
jgi:hypothetical protein